MYYPSSQACSIDSRYKYDGEQAESYCREESKRKKGKSTPVAEVPAKRGGTIESCKQALVTLKLVSHVIFT